MAGYHGGAGYHKHYMGNYLKTEDRELFRNINIEIRKHPERYSGAGKWLDAYYSVENFWKRREEDLENQKAFVPHILKPGEVFVNEDGTTMSREESEKENQRELIIYEKEIEYLELMIKLQKGYEPHDDLAKHWTSQPEKYTIEKTVEMLNKKGRVSEEYRLSDACERLMLFGYISPFMKLKNARRVLLITWLLSDPESENSGLNLTQFENWNWSNRCLSIYKFLYSKKDAYSEKNMWMPLVHIAWEKVKAEKDLESEKSIKIDENIKTVGESKKAVWKPPKGYIGSKEIVNDYKVPRSTLQGWSERDKAKVKRDPQTKEVYYTKKWFSKRYKNYRPRRKS